MTKAEKLEAKIASMRGLKEVMAEKGTPTLKAIAIAHDLPPVRLYSVAKQPKVGEVYDAKVYNWEAIERFIARRFDEKGFQNFEQVVDAALKIDEELKLKDKRRRTGKRVATIEIDGKSVPMRKYPSFEKDAGMFICLKDDINVYKIVYQTKTHTVLVPVDDEKGTVTSNRVIIKSNGMLNYKGVGPEELDETIKRNFAAQAEARAAQKLADEEAAKKTSKSRR